MVMISTVRPVSGASLLRAWVRGASILALLMPLVPRALDAQSWNGARALELVDRARGVRQAVAVDSTLTNYRADARGFVYFFLELRQAEGRGQVLPGRAQGVVEVGEQPRRWRTRCLYHESVHEVLGRLGKS